VRKVEDWRKGTRSKLYVKVSVDMDDEWDKIYLYVYIWTILLEVGGL
jgi:hypothetical protein